MRCKQELGGSENPLDEAVLEFNAKIVGRAGAGDWLNALPSKALGLHLRNREFIPWSHTIQEGTKEELCERILEVIDMTNQYPW